MKGKRSYQHHAAEKTETHPQTVTEVLLKYKPLNAQTAELTEEEVKLRIGLVAIQLSWFQLLRLSHNMDSPLGLDIREMVVHSQSEYLEMVNHLQSMSDLLKILIFTWMASPLITASDIERVGIAVELDNILRDCLK